MLSVVSSALALVASVRWLRSSSVLTSAMLRDSKAISKVSRTLAGTTTSATASIDTLAASAILRRRAVRTVAEAKSVTLPATTNEVVKTTGEVGSDEDGGEGVGGNGGTIFK